MFDFFSSLNFESTMINYYIIIMKSHTVLALEIIMMMSDVENMQPNYCRHLQKEVYLTKLNFFLFLKVLTFDLIHVYDMAIYLTK